MLQIFSLESNFIEICISFLPALTFAWTVANFLVFTFLRGVRVSKRPGLRFIAHPILNESIQNNKILTFTLLIDR